MTAREHAEALRRLADYLDSIPNVEVCSAGTNIYSAGRVQIYLLEEFVHIAGRDLTAEYYESGYTHYTASKDGIELVCCVKQKRAEEAA